MMVLAGCSDLQKGEWLGALDALPDAAADAVDAEVDTPADGADAPDVAEVDAVEAEVGDLPVEEGTSPEAELQAEEVVQDLVPEEAVAEVADADAVETVDVEVAVDVVEVLVDLAEAEATDVTVCGDGGPLCCKVDADCTGKLQDVGEDACHPATCHGGACEAPALSTGAGCEDGDPCTTGDSCQADGEKLVCKAGGGLLNCNDNIGCTLDACVAGSGCTHTVRDSECDDGNVCTTDSCNPVAGCQRVANSVSCGPAFCDASGFHDAVFCDGKACPDPGTVSCDDHNPCTTDTCDAALGCQHSNRDGACAAAKCVGTAWYDAATCVDGACPAQVPTECVDSDPCTSDACDATLGCPHTRVSAVCADARCEGDSFYAAAICDADGKCPAQAAEPCDDGNPCTLDSCAPTGCQHVGVSQTVCAAANCDGGLFHPAASCTADFKCPVQAAMACDDNNACTDNTCVTDSCQYTANAATCSGQGLCAAGTCGCLGAWDFPTRVQYDAVDHAGGNTGGAVAVAIGDLDHDGRPDLVTADMNTNSLCVLHNTGDPANTWGLPKPSSIDPDPARHCYPLKGAPASVALVDLDGDGWVDLVAAAPSRNAVDLLFNAKDGTFGAAVEYLVGAGTSPVGAVVGDLDGDGLPDIVTCNSGTGTVTLLMNQGAGKFPVFAPTTYGVGSAPLGCTLADVNHDGHPDIVAANPGSDVVSVLINAGDGSFLPEASYGTGRQPHFVVAADFDADGHVDLAVVNHGAGTISFLKGAGDGTFAPRVDSGIVAGGISNAPGNQVNLVAADFEGDGRVDLAVVSGANATAVLRNQGDGTFLRVHEFIDGGAGQAWLAAGDLNGDGRPDLVAAAVTDGLLTLWLSGCGDAPTCAIASPCETAGWDAGKQRCNPPVVDGSSCRTSGTCGGGICTVGLWGFSPGPRLQGAQGPASVAIADVTRDGVPDLVVANADADPGTITVYEGAGAGSFVVGVDFLASARVTSLAVGNLDVDTWPDVVTTDFTGDGLAILMNQWDQPAARFAVSRFPAGARPQNVAIGDVDGDGNPDLVVASGDISSQEVQVLLGPTSPLPTDGTFGVAIPIPIRGFQPHGLALADVNHDGLLDVIVSNDQGKSVDILLNTTHTVGLPTFAFAIEYPLGGSSWDVAVADLDGDGNLDLVVPTLNARVDVFRGNGDGTFARWYDIATTNYNNYSVAVGDVDGDGIPDVLAGKDGGVAVFQGRGNCRFGSAVTWAVDGTPYDLALGDLDGDGRPDLVSVSGPSYTTVNVWLNGAAP